MSKGEIRGFNAGTFFSKTDDSVILKISRTDDCVIVELADIESDSIYKFSIPFDAENESEIPFEFYSFEENRKKEQEF